MLTLDDSSLSALGQGARSEEAAVLAREVAWEPLLTARLVGDRDLQYIKRYDKRDLATRRELLAEEGPAYVEAFLAVLRNVTQQDTVQYVLALLEDMVGDDEKYGELFL